MFGYCRILSCVSPFLLQIGVTAAVGGASEIRSRRGIAVVVVCFVGFKSGLKPVRGLVAGSSPASFFFPLTITNSLDEVTDGCSFSLPASSPPSLPWSPPQP